jgi:hypothetical protein
MSEDEVKRLLAEGKTARARQLMRERELGISPESRPLGPVAGLLFFLAVLTAITVAVNLRHALPRSCRISLAWTIARSRCLVAGAFASFTNWSHDSGADYPSCRCSARGKIPSAGAVSRRDHRARAGVHYVLAIAVPRVAYRSSVLGIQDGTPLVRWIHFDCMLTGGLEAIRMANNTPRDDSWEFLN